MKVFIVYDIESKRLEGQKK